jgi:hypothetical protein
METTSTLPSRNVRWLGLALAVTGVAGYAVMQWRRSALDAEVDIPRDYSDRSGFPRSPDEMRGVAASLARAADIETPAALREP